MTLIPLLLALGLAAATTPARADDGYLSIRLVSGDFHPVHYRHDHGYYYKHRDRHRKHKRHYRKHYKHHGQHGRHGYQKRHYRHYDRHDGHYRHGKRSHDRHHHSGRSRIGIGYTGRH